jgi:hypothetical protein
MIRRVAYHLVLMMTGLLLATVVLVGAMSVLVSVDLAAPLLPEIDHVATVARLAEEQAKPEHATDGVPTPAIVLVLAGIVMLAAQPPVQRIHVYHRSYQRSGGI